MTDLACRGLVAVAGSSGGQRWQEGPGCWGGKPGSSHRACSPAGTRQDIYTLLKSSSLICVKHRFLICIGNFSCRGIIPLVLLVLIYEDIWRSWEELTWICCWSRLILCCCWISCCCCLAIWDTRHVHFHTPNVFKCTQCRWPLLVLHSGTQLETPPNAVHCSMYEFYGCYLKKCSNFILRSWTNWKKNTFETYCEMSACATTLVHYI